MQPYSVKLTIEGLYGAFAEKYACFLKDAHHVHRLLLQLGAKAPEGPILIAQSGSKQTPFDPMALLSRFIRYLTKIAKDQPTRRFFTGVRLEPADGSAPTPWTASISGEDNDGPFTIHAWGLSASLSRDSNASALNLTVEASPVYTTPQGRYVCRFGTLSEMFRDSFTRLVEICEEALAKNQNILASEQSYAGAPTP